MNRESIREIRKTIQDLLSDADGVFKDQFRVTVKLGNASFGMNNATLKIEIADLTDTGEAITREAEDFKRCAIKWGLSPDDLGEVFINPYDGKTYTIIGARTRSQKYPILGKQTNGKVYKLSHIMVKSALQNKLNKDTSTASDPNNVWCNCGNPSESSKYHADDPNSTTCTKHHWTCGDCGKILQVG